MATMAVGNYQTACEASPHKNQIDAWLNENKSCSEISRLLNSQFGEKISDRSVSKYKKYRDEFISTELEKDPAYQGTVMAMEEHLNDSIAKIKKVDALAELSTIINNSAEMLQDAKTAGIKIRSVQDIRFVSQTMLDAIKLYGDTVLRAQRYAKVEEDPSLLRPTTINVNIKSALADILSRAISNGGTGVIDQLRAGINGQSMNIMDSADAEQEMDGE